MSDAHETKLAVGEGRSTKVSVSMAEGTIEAVRGQVGVREFSAFVAEAVERELRRQNLRAAIAQHEREHGEIPEEATEKIEARWQEAMRRQARWPEKASV